MWGLFEPTLLALVELCINVVTKAAEPPMGNIVSHALAGWTSDTATKA